MIKKCLVCKKEFNPNPSNVRKGGGKFCSRKCYFKQALAHKKGTNSPFWKGKEASVGSIHDVIKASKGKAVKCENPKCLNKSTTFDWALLKGKKYSDRNPDDFWQLCRKCHKAYDFKEKNHPRNSKGVFI